MLLTIAQFLLLGLDRRADLIGQIHKAVFAIRLLEDGFVEIPLRQIELEHFSVGCLPAFLLEEVEEVCRQQHPGIALRDVEQFLDVTILFGDLEDPASEVRQALKTNYTVRRKPGLGTSPSVYYII